MLQTALRLEGGTDIDTDGSVIRFQMSGLGGHLRSNWHWAAYVSGGEIRIESTSDGYEVRGTLSLWKFSLIALAAPGILFLLGMPLWGMALFTGAGWFWGYQVARTSFETWIGDVLLESPTSEHRAPLAP